MKIVSLFIIIISIFSMACNNGANAINEVPVIHARVLSVQNNGCELMIMTDKNIRAEVELFSCYHHPVLQDGNLIILERWKSGFVYKGINENENPEDFNYHESLYSHDLD